MAEKFNKDSLTKAELFFQRARKVLESENYDYAIDLYLEGIRCAPDETHRGHIPLFELGLLRASKGGKKPTVVEKMKKARGKDPLEKLINHEYLLVKDPENNAHAEQMLQACLEGGYEKAALWVADMLFQRNSAAEKPSVGLYLMLKDAYKELHEWERGLAALRCAVKLRPEDRELAVECKDFTAELAVSKGKYNVGEDFRVSIKDREKQEELHSQKGVVRSKDYQQLAIDTARREYLKDPELPKNIFRLANELAGTQQEKFENEAIAILVRSADEQKNFSFEQRAGEIRISQLKRKLRLVHDVLEKDPGNKAARDDAKHLKRRIETIELHFYKRCVENYPTDTKMKYEYASRLMSVKKWDEAIPLLQETQRDPKYRIMAMNKVGLCFFEKEWYSDAVDIFTNALEMHKIKDDSVGKNLQYNLARCYEEMDEKQKAIEIFRKIAQIDFAYKDVRDRVNKLRNEVTGPTSQ